MLGSYISVNMLPDNLRPVPTPSNRSTKPLTINPEIKKRHKITNLKERLSSQKERFEIEIKKLQALVQTETQHS